MNALKIIPLGRYPHLSYRRESCLMKYEEKTGIHLVSTTPAPRSEERRLKLGDYTADIVVSRREKNLCYYVIQRVGSAEIIEMQPFANPKDAEAAAERALKRWNRQDGLRHAAN